MPLKFQGDREHGKLKFKAEHLGKNNVVYLDSMKHVTKSTILCNTKTGGISTRQVFSSTIWYTSFSGPFLSCQKLWGENTDLPPDKCKLIEISVHTVQTYYQSGISRGTFPQIPPGGGWRFPTFTTDLQGTETSSPGEKSHFER